MSGVVTAIFAVFTSILDWFVESLGSVSTLFYTTDGLTFIGTCTIITFGIGIITMVVAMVRSLLRGQG